MADIEAKKRRSIAKARFTRICRSLDAAIEQYKPQRHLDIINTDLKAAWETVCARHDEVLMLSDVDDADHIKWILDLELVYYETREKINEGRSDAVKDKFNE